MRQSTQERTDREHGHAGHVEALAAKAICQPSGDGEHNGARDQIAGQDPGGFFLATTKRPRNVRKRDIGDGGIEHLHEGGQRHRERDGPWVVTWLPLFGHPASAGSIRVLIEYQEADMVRASQKSGRTGKTPPEVLKLTRRMTTLFRERLDEKLRPLGI